ncbi:hypothetical protein I5L01_15630 [Erythrobacter sp. YJ-T3-07]|nr:hypothetical protein [Erythrobacter sp. YJ-T3-07]
MDQGRKWFLVVDNTDSMDVLFGAAGSIGQGIHPYLPTTENCTFLFTTRLRDIALSVADTDMVELTEMTSQEANDFFRKAIQVKTILTDNQTVTELLN